MTRFAFLIFLFPTFCFSQTVNTTTKSGRENIHNDAIKHFITFTSRSDKSIYDTLFILKDNLLTDSLQSTIQKTTIVLIDSIEISNRLQGDNSFIAYKLYPLSFDNGFFYINIVLFHVFKDKSGIVLANTGTCIVSYTYDNTKKSFKVYRSACNGF